MLATLALPAHAQAASSASATMAVSIEVVPNCTVAAEPLAFGAVTADAAPSTETTAAIDVACGPGTPFSVALDDGQNAGDGARRALDPATGQYLAYEIYVDPAHAQRWGGFGADAVSGETSASGTTQLTAYGEIAGAGEVAAGSYSDLVTVSVDF